MFGLIEEKIKVNFADDESMGFIGRNRVMDRKDWYQVCPLH